MLLHCTERQTDDAPAAAQQPLPLIKANAKCLDHLMCGAAAAAGRALNSE